MSQSAPKRKKYKASTIAIVAAANKWAAEKKALGWTRQDFANGLKKMFDSPTGDL